jgi:hypothetical protein
MIFSDRELARFGLSPTITDWSVVVGDHHRPSPTIADHRRPSPTIADHPDHHAP